MYFLNPYPERLYIPVMFFFNLQASIRYNNTWKHIAYVLIIRSKLKSLLQNIVNVWP